MTWDFRKDFGIARVYWPKDAGDTAYMQYGDFDFQMLWPSGHEVKGRAFFLDAERKGDKVSRVVVHLGFHSTPDESYTIAKTLMDEWLFDAESQERLEKWHNGIKKVATRGDSIRFGNISEIEIQTTDQRAQTPADRSWSVVFATNVDLSMPPMTRPATRTAP